MREFVAEPELRALDFVFTSLYLREGLFRMGSDLSTIAEDLGIELREARVRSNLTQAELARRLRVTSRTVQAWEAGTFPRAEHRRRIARFLEKAA